MRLGREEFAFANDPRAALEYAPSRAWIELAIVIGMLLIALLWARWATLDEVTTAVGRVIPSSQIQVVQTLEPGIVREIRVKEGDSVEKDQVLLRLDDTGVASSLGEYRQRILALRAETERLVTEASGAAEVNFDAALVAEAPETVAAETDSFHARQAKLAGDIAIFEQQVVQREQELRELEAKRVKTELTIEPLDRELTLTRKLKSSGAVPLIDLLRLERQMAEYKGELNVILASVPGARSAIQEATRRVENARASFGADARERLAKARAELAVLVESERAAKDRVVRTTLRAPVRGIVNKLNVTTIGAVIQPAVDIVEIVPLDDSLLIEARVPPKDVAFIRPEQSANVKLSAYDYLTYGSLKGRVERISADTFTDSEKQTFYRVVVRTNEIGLAHEGAVLPILPGMVATVDILTGRRSVIEYLLKPISTVRQEALRER